jgi:hypothetical protein
MAITLVFVGIAGRGSAQNAGSLVNDQSQRELILDFIGTLSGNYGGAATHGDVLDFTAPAPNGFGLPEYAPTIVQVQELVQAGAAVPGFKYQYCPGPNISTPDGCTPQGGVLNISGAGAGSGQGSTEITEGAAYSTATPTLDGQKLLIRAWFGKT